MIYFSHLFLQLLPQGIGVSKLHSGATLVFHLILGLSSLSVRHCGPYLPAFCLGVLCNIIDNS
jgi:hypothetical protein